MDDTPAHNAQAASCPDDLLFRYGYTDRERALYGELAGTSFEPARVARVDRGLPLVVSQRGLERAEPATHLIKSSGSAASRAVVGDWVALGRPDTHEMPLIEAILPRHGAFARKDPGEETGEQVIIANVDIVFVVQSLSGGGVNVARLERELVLAWESGAVPVVVLTKADACEDVELQVAAAAEVAFGVDVIAESAVTGMGVDEIRARVPQGVTAALLGGSGVGKSTLINRIVGDELLATQAVRAGDDKGRHTTVAREMVTIPDGGVVIDTPGMRAIALWDAEEGIAAAFPDIEEYALACRFRDCLHEDEPGCAVVAAVEAGDVPLRRLESYRKLTAELSALARRKDEKMWRERDRESRLISKAVKRFYQTEPKGRRQ